MQIPKDIPFHRAISDAVYTARVFQMIKDPIALQRVSFDTFQLPENHRSEVHVVFDNYAKYISRPFPDKEALMADKEFFPPDVICAIITFAKKSAGSRQTASTITVCRGAISTVG